MTASFTEQQRQSLLAPIDGFRVQDLDGISHLAAWDVTAHLNRMFGFEGWDKTILDLEPVYEHVGQREVGHRNNCRRQGCECRTRSVPACSVGYRCTMRLTIRNPDGETVRVVEDAAMGTATNQRDLGDAHDLALKSAVSYALKRCAKDLGDQFGLSLYNKGQETACVQVVFPYGADQDTANLDVEIKGDGIAEGDDGFGDKRGDRSEPAAQPQGNPAADVPDTDQGQNGEARPEPVREPAPAQPKAAEKPEPTPPAEAPSKPGVTEEQTQDWYAEITTATDNEALRRIWKDIDKHGALDAPVTDLKTEKQMALREVLVRRVQEIETQGAA